MLSMQPKIVLWVSVGSALRVLGDYMHPHSIRVPGARDPHDDWRVLAICIVSSFPIRAVLGCITGQILDSTSTQVEGQYDTSMALMPLASQEMEELRTSLREK